MENNDSKSQYKEMESARSLYEENSIMGKKLDLEHVEEVIEPKITAIDKLTLIRTEQPLQIDTEEMIYES